MGTIRYHRQLSKQINIIIFIILITSFNEVVTQDYDVGDIQCLFASQDANNGDLITAKLKRPAGFKGSPLFADDRNVNPELDRNCIIKPDPTDTAQLSYNLEINDFTKCGVLKRNGFVHVRIWFPQFPGVVMHSDQELIIMCKPPEPTVIENKAAGFAGSFPNSARVSGVVEETPGRLEYEVALYKEAPPINRVGIASSPLSSKDPAISLPSSNELAVNQAVPIGTKLQLRARISTQSVWKYVKLMEVTVSSDPENAHSKGYVSLVHNACRNRDFVSIIPHQPSRYRDRPNEVFLDFEAFLLSSMEERSTLWIHSQIKACIEAVDCQPDFCLDLFDSSGHGRKKREIFPINSTDSTRIRENIEYTVIMPGEIISNNIENENCRSYFLASGILGILLAVSTALILSLIIRLQDERKSKLDNITNSFKGYTGRAIGQ